MAQQPEAWAARVALDDGIEQGALFCNMLAENLGNPDTPGTNHLKMVRNIQAIQIPTGTVLVFWRLKSRTLAARQRAIPGGGGVGGRLGPDGSFEIPIRPK